MLLLAFFLQISGSALLMLLLYLIIGGLIFYVLWWGLQKIGLPDPFNKIAQAVIVAVAVILLINLLLGLVGKSFIKF